MSYSVDPLKNPKESKELAEAERKERAKKFEEERRAKAQIIESFQWAAGEIKQLKSKSPKTALLKIVAARADDVSLNDRKYVRDELMKSARTFTGKPITINHNPNRKVGTIISSDFEDDQLEILGEITVEPYATMIKHKTFNMKGVSIDANYRYNLCPRCKEWFETDELFYDHLEREHGLQNLTREPHGIYGTGLALVTEDETPGIANTSAELVETVGDFQKLAETVMHERGFSLQKSEGAVPISTSGIAKPKAEEDLKLGEPFADYKDFDDCVAKNSDKEDPKAYCASIERQLHGEIDSIEKAAEMVVWLENNLQQPHKAIYEKFMAYFDKEAESIIKERGEIVGLKQKIADLEAAKTADIKESFNVLEAVTKERDALKETVAEKDKAIAEKDRKIVEYENQLDKVKGAFKGYSKKATIEPQEYAEDPLKKSVKR